MDSTTDPWTASPHTTEKPSTDSSTDSTTALSPEFAPFTIRSCRKTYDARLLPRKKWHMGIYALFVCLYAALWSSTLWVGFDSLESVTRAVLLTSIIEISLVGWMIKYMFQHRNDGGWGYQFHLFSAVIVRAFTWSLLVEVPFIIFEIYQPTHALFTWYADDLYLAYYILYLILLIQGARYFTKAVDDE